MHDELEEGSFDLVHSRLVLEHLPDRDRALARMVRALAPGGWLVVESFQLTSMAVASARPGSAMRWASVALPALFRAALLAMRPAGLDARIGHRLPAELCRFGLVDVEAEGRAVFLRGGSPAASVATLSLARFGEILTDPPALTAPALWTPAGLLHRLPPLRRQLALRLDRLRALFDNDDVWVMAPVLVAARGRRPPAWPQAAGASLGRELQSAPSACRANSGPFTTALLGPDSPSSEHDPGALPGGHVSNHHRPTTDHQFVRCTATPPNRRHS